MSIVIFAEFPIVDMTNCQSDILVTFMVHNLAYLINYLTPAVGYMQLRLAVRRGQHYKTICIGKMSFQKYDDWQYVRFLKFGILAVGIEEFGNVQFNIVEFGIVEFGIIELGIVEFGNVKVGIVEFSIVEFGNVEFDIAT
jgi:hypothetical protein